MYCLCFRFRKIYIYSISRNIVEKAIERLNLNAKVTKNIDDADLVIFDKHFNVLITIIGGDIKKNII